MEGARKAFLTFLKDYQDHHLADNAQYWIGESYYTERNYEMALLAFQRVIEDYPRGNKVPDAMLKVALSLKELGRMEEAKKALVKLIQEYPSSEAATIARNRLRNMEGDRGITLPGLSR